MILPYEIYLIHQVQYAENDSNFKLYARWLFSPLSLPHRYWRGLDTLSQLQTVPNVSWSHP